MISIGQAQQLILEQTAVLPDEEVLLPQGLGRVIAEDVRAPRDMPSSDTSAMDGYAFSHELLQSNLLKVVGFIPAGTARTFPVPPGNTVRIMTGAPVPPGCDTVVPIEDVEVLGEEIRLKGDIRPGNHIRKRGEHLAAGRLAVPSGTPIRAQEIGMLASLGRSSLRVHGIPHVAVIATGDELVDVGSVPGAAKIINSNSYCLGAQVAETGARATLLGIARDTRESTREKMLAGLQADLVIISGGVSAGDKDHVKEVLEELGAEIIFWKVNMKPGKPVAFAMLNGKAVFALPGNPVAAMVGFEQFVRPALLKMMGHRRVFRTGIRAIAAHPVTNRCDRPHLLLASVTTSTDGHCRVATNGVQDSANLASTLAANALMLVAPGETVAAGAEVEVTLLNGSVDRIQPCP